MKTKDESQQYFLIFFYTLSYEMQDFSHNFDISEVPLSFHWTQYYCVPFYRLEKHSRGKHNSFLEYDPPSYVYYTFQTFPIKLTPFQCLRIKIELFLKHPTNYYYFFRIVFLLLSSAPITSAYLWILCNISRVTALFITHLSHSLATFSFTLLNDNLCSLHLLHCMWKLTAEKHKPFIKTLFSVNKYGKYR